MHARLGERLKGLAALIGLVAVLAGPPLALARLVGWPLPRSVPTLDGITMSLQEGVADEVVVNVLAVLAWLVWIQIAAAAVAELAALARGCKASRAPVVAGVQIGVAKMVAACALLAGVAAQRSAPAAPPRLIAVTRPAPRAPAQAEVPPRLQAVVGAPVAAGPAAGYTVRRGDSWWAIAEAQLGDGQRWKELRAANAGRTMPDGEVVGASTDDIRPGWTLVVPGTPPAAVANATTADVVVRRGDSLWSITQDHLAAEEGHRAAETDVRRRWAEVIDLNRDRLADPANPNLIFAGQVLRFPGGAGVASIAPAAVAAAPAPPAPPPPAPVVQPSPPAPEQATVPTTVAAPEPIALPVREPRSPSQGPHAEVKEPTDRRRVVPAGLLGTAGTMLAVGVGRSLTRRRRRRLSELPPRAIEPPAPAALDDLRAEVCRRADTDHADRLHCALRDVARAVGEARSDARPRLVQVSPKRVEVLLSRALVPAPKGWRAEASGTVWSLAGEPADTDVDGPATTPTLVSLGRPDASTEVYLDLEAEGVVALVGDDDLVVDLARSWALELAMSPLAAGVTVKLVGDLAGLAPDEGRVFTAQSWSEVADDARAWVEQTSALVAAHGWASPFAGRVGEHDDGLSPLVLVGRPADDEVFASLCRLVLDTEAVVVIVAVGGEVEGATVVEVTTAGLSIPDLGLRCEPQAVTAESAHQVEELLDDATVVPDQLSFLPDRPPPPVKIGEEADTYRDPPFEVLVRVLGDIEVVGGKRKLTPQETAVVAYLALHSPASAAQVADAIWSAPTESRQKSLTNVLYQCRGALGPLNIPKCDQDGRYKVGPGLVTDLELFRRRATYAAGQRPQDAVATLRGALELATGPVFTSRPAERSSFVWVDVEYWMSHTELAVTDTAEDLVGRYLDLKDMEGAIWAARQGLLVCRTHARLTELLMEAYLANGDALAARRVYESHQTALQKMEIDGIDPDGLLDVYRKAGTGRDPAG